MLVDEEDLEALEDEPDGLAEDEDEDEGEKDESLPGVGGADRGRGAPAQGPGHCNIVGLIS